MQDEGTGKEWGVKSIERKRDDGHGNIEFLVEWDGNWADIGLALGNPLQVTLKMRGAHTCVSKPHLNPASKSVARKGTKKRKNRE